MIYHYEGFYDPMEICLVSGYVEANEIKDALKQATALVIQKAEAVSSRLDYCRVSKLEETNIKIKSRVK